MKCDINVTEVHTTSPCIPKIQFPTKLWEAINSPKHLISWSDDGLSVVVDDQNFEKNVMKTFPGLVQIPSFANFRRQMRWYGFSWRVDEDDFFVFEHPFFQIGREDLLEYVVTRRRKRRVHSPFKIFDDDTDDASLNSHQRVTRRMVKLRKNKADCPSSPSMEVVQSHKKDGKKPNRFLLSEETCEVGTQTKITMCSDNTQFLGIIEQDRYAEPLYSFDSSDKYLLDHLQSIRYPNCDSRAKVNQDLQDRFAPLPTEPTPVSIHFFDDEFPLQTSVGMSDITDRVICNL